MYQASSLPLSHTPAQPQNLESRTVPHKMKMLSFFPVDMTTCFRTLSISRLRTVLKLA